MTQLTTIGIFFPYDTTILNFVKGKIRRQLPPYRFFPVTGVPSNRFPSALLLAEGLTVGALIHSGICLVGTYQNAVQRTEIGILTVMGALLDSTLNALIGVTIHKMFPPFLSDTLSMPPNEQNIQSRMYDTSAHPVLFFFGSFRNPVCQASFLADHPELFSHLRSVFYAYD